MSKKVTNEAITPHVLALPFPEHGHINPLLRLCGHLASQGVAITFVITEDVQAQMFDLHPWTSQPLISKSFQFATIAGGFHGDVEAEKSMDSLKETQMLASAIEGQKDVLRQMMMDSQSSNLPVSCFLVDFMFMGLASSLCDELQIRKATYFPLNGWFFTFSTGDYPLAGGYQFNIQELEKAIPLIGRSQDIRKKFNDGLRSFSKDGLVLINTFEKLEEPSLRATISPCHVCYVGPVIPIDVNHNISRFQTNIRGKNECIAWLEKQEEHSVLYISFGTITCLNSKQLEEVAFGIQHSKRKFIWVMRNNIDLLPHGFLEQTHGQGLLVKWAPQLDVLGHPSIGGFLTHCGWNSIIESIYMGVPLLCFPQFADQHINSLLVTKIWKFGVLISRESIQNSIDQLMNSVELRQQASLLRIYAHEATKQGGTSHVTLQTIVNILKQKF